MDDLIPITTEIFNFFSSELAEIAETIFRESQQQDPAVCRIVL